MVSTDQWAQHLEQHPGSNGKADQPQHTPMPVQLQQQGQGNHQGGGRGG